MLIVDPSYEIQDELDQAPLVVRLEACGRICYKSEDKISRQSALPFVSKIAAHGHNSVLEMAVVTLSVRCEPDRIDALVLCQPKYLFIDRIDSGCLITGSIRAFREIYKLHPEIELVNGCLFFLASRHSYLFEGVYDPAAARPAAKDIEVSKLTLAEVDRLPDELLLRHRHVGVKFVVSRAVTHELVRHRPCSFLQESQRYCRYSEDKFANQVSFIRPLFYETGSAEFEVWQQAMLETEKRYLQLLETSTPQAARTVLPNSCKTEIITYCNLAEWKHIFSLRTIPAAEPSMREVMIPLAAELGSRFPCLKRKVG